MTRKTLLKRIAGFSILGGSYLFVLALAVNQGQLKGVLVIMGVLAGLAGFVWFLEWLLCSKD